jgi:hypothetical protein
MLPVIYSMSVSLDGFIAGPTGDIGWSAPDAEQMRFHIEQTRHVAAHLCGRGLYQEMLVWETAEQTMSGEAGAKVRPDLAADPEGGVFPDAEFGGGQGAAGYRRHRHRSRPTP